MPLDLFTKKRLGFWVIVLLVVLNLSVIGTFWWTHFQHPPLPQPEPSHSGTEELVDPMPFLTRDLRLSRRQMLQLHQMRMQTLPDIREKWQEMHRLRRSLHEAMFAEETDPNQIQTWSKRIGELQAELEWTKYDHLLAIKSICTPKQRQRLRGLLEEVMHRTRPPGRPRHGGPGRGRGRGGPGRGGPGGRGPGPRGPMHPPPRGPDGPPELPPGP